jgi:hypothetical protein
MPRRDGQLVGDLTERQPKPAKAMHRSQAVEATVPLGIRMELVNERKLAIPPGSGSWKDALDKRPRPFQLLVRELLWSRPTSPRFRIRRQILSVDVVGTMRPSNRYQPSRPDVESQGLDMAPETAGSFVQLHQL